MRRQLINAASALAVYRMGEGGLVRATPISGGGGGLFQVCKSDLGKSGSDWAQMRHISGLFHIGFQYILAGEHMENI